MRKDFSPEEKLLRLIKGTRKKEAAKKEAAPEVDLSAGMPAHQEKLGAKTSKAASISLPFKLREFNTRALNSVLIVILAGLLLYFVYDLFYTSYQPKKMDILQGTDKGKAPAAAVEKEKLDIKPYSFYSSSIEGRNIFMPQEVETEIVITGPTLEEISSSLSLIGIIAGERPQAIIEDKKSGKSYFLYKGGLAGKAKIVEILNDSVVMEYEGETFELVL